MTWIFYNLFCPWVSLTTARRAIRWLPPIRLGLLISSFAWIAVLVFGDGGVELAWGLLEAAYQTIFLDGRKVFGDDTVKDLAIDQFVDYFRLFAGTAAAFAALGSLELALYYLVTGQRFRTQWKFLEGRKILGRLRDGGDAATTEPDHLLACVNLAVGRAGTCRGHACPGSPCPLMNQAAADDAATEVRADAAAIGISFTVAVAMVFVGQWAVNNGSHGRDTYTWADSVAAAMLIIVLFAITAALAMARREGPWPYRRPQRRDRRG